MSEQMVQREGEQEYTRDDHAVIARGSETNYTPRYHDVVFENGTFRPRCGTTMDMAVLVRTEELPLRDTESWMGYGRGEYVACRRCRDQREASADE